jgi:hypothetical protein
MSRLVIFLLGGFLVSGFYGFGQELTGPEVIDRSITFHDPENLWVTGHFLLDLRETRPNGSDRNTLVDIDNSNGFFCAIRNMDGHSYEYTMKDDDCIQSYDFNYELSEEDREKHNLTCERTQTLRNYYLYLWGLPMKLKDVGTIVEEKVERVVFNESEVLSVRITYDPAVGSDTWYFYFDQKDYRLVGYRFYHNEADNDGEYITLTEIHESGSIKFPRKRKWVMNIDDKILGEDILENVRIF